MKKDLRLKIIISNYDDINNPYYGGGGAIAIHEVAKRLVANHKITVIAGKYPGSEDRVIDKVSYLHIGYSKAGPLLGQLLFQFLLPYYVKVKSHDVWIESFTPPFSTAFIPLFTKRPVIGLAQLLGGKDKSKQYKLPFHIIENFGLKFYKNFIVLTQDTSEKIKNQSHSANIKVIPNGINPIMPKVKVKQERKHILYLGRIEIQQKGLDMLLRSFSKVADKIGLDLIIAGSGIKRDINILNNLIKKLKLHKAVKIIGKVDGEKKTQLINNASLFAMPSRFESFGIVALEGFAYKCPLICFDIDGLKWIPKNCAVKVTPFDETKYAMEMERLVKNNKLRKSLRENCYKFSKTFNWDDIAKQYERFIQEVKYG